MTPPLCEAPEVHPRHRISLTAAAESPSAVAAVLAHLDPADRAEAVAGGLPADPRALVRVAVPHWISLGAHGGGAWAVWDHRPEGGAAAFALLGVSIPRPCGVAEVGLLACHHHAHARPLGRLALLLRQALPVWARARGLRRLEARSWFDHPRASTLLFAIGFAPDAQLMDHGADGETFELWSLLTAAPATYPSPMQEPAPCA